MRDGASPVKEDVLRHLRVVGLIVVAVLAVAGCAGAATASATRLCGTNTTPCANVYANDTTFGLHLKTGTGLFITTSGGLFNWTMSCNSSAWGVTTSNQGGGAGVAVGVRLASGSYTGCSSQGTTGCASSLTVSATGATGVVTSTAGMNGTLQLVPPTVTMHCPIGGNTTACTYGGSGTLDGTVTGGSPAIVDFVNQSFPSIGGFGCPTASTWNFQYQTTVPLYISPS
jgi:hypothetical protein